MTEILDRVVVTGAGGRLGTALLRELAACDGTTPIPWRRPVYDLDGTDPIPLLDRDEPSLVMHAAAWTDVDGCARDPELAFRRNAEAVERLARACVARKVPLVHVSTAEVFSGDRSDGTGYAETDEPSPQNPYGASKLAGEVAALDAFAGAAGLWVLRTGWLFGPPGQDFPEKIVAASDRRPEDDPLPVVFDETGSPTFTRDLASAALIVITMTEGGTFHIVNRGITTRFEWAQTVLDRCRPGRHVDRILQSEYVRASKPPKWAVLDCSKASELGADLRDWRDALGSYLETIC